LISKRTVHSFVWRDVCAGWRLVDAADLQVIQERMPPTASELLHVHARATQMYFVLEGEATVDLGDISEVLQPGEAVLIEPRVAHRISNRTEQPLEFLVISSSPTRDDREDLE
jgi:mannose-6-phosphate isomerase-like protein (cupin superfamily)